jgi:single-strand DNA-binding protein
MNKWTGHGFTGKDPVIMNLESGKKIAKFTFATSDSYKDSTGNKQTNTEWHNIIVWEKLADLCEKWVKKGTELIIEGKITYRNYTDKEGIVKYFTEIICSNIEFCGKKESELEPQKGKITTGSMSDINDLPGANDDPFDPFK